MVQGKKNEFKLRKFLSSTFICSALHTSLISCVLIPYFKFNNMLPLQISILVTIKRLIRLVSDVFFGFIFDLFGAKIVFTIGRFLKLSSYIILLLQPSFLTLCFAMVIYGFSEGTIQGKVSSFIYNNLKANNHLSLFSKAISMYYLVIDLHIALFSFLAGILLKHYGYNVVIYISIITNIISIGLILKLIPNKSENNLHQFISKSFKDILQTLRFVVGQHNLFVYLIAMYGILVFFAWQFGSIASMVLLDMGMTGTGIAMLGSAVKICMAIGTLIPILIIKHTISLSNVSNILFFIISIGFISSITYNIYLFCIFMLLCDLFYVLIEVSLEKNLENLSDNTIRGTAISLAMTFANIVAGVANLFIGIVAQYLNYRIALFAIMFIMFLSIVFLTFIVHKKSKIN